VLLWGLWLLTLLVAFSVAGQINAYYLAALAPPVAALCAIGARTFWSARERRWAWAALAAVVAISAVYAVALLPAGDAPGWLTPAAAILGAAAVLLVGAAAIHRDLTQRTRLTRVALVAALAAPVLVPAVAAASIVAGHRGPFDTPFQPPAITAVTETLAARLNHPPASLIGLERRGTVLRYPLATYTSLLGAPLIFATGEEVLPIGGFTGTNPSPTLAHLKPFIAHRELAVILGPTTTDPRMRWAADHCQMPVQGLPIPVLVCGPAAG
jgi:4-amino-4-deoxy-L-arabinose transferase-like glycosyltransferase